MKKNKYYIRINLMRSDCNYLINSSEQDYDYGSDYEPEIGEVWAI